jgi:Concanavalin A-like lectin/glucanases superfamily
MIRDSLAANAANALIAVTPGNGVTWQYRSSTGGGSSFNNATGLSAPYWVKLVRSGNTFTGYYSADGANWTQLGTTTISMGSTAYVGLAVTSHNNSGLCMATFDNVSAPGWPPPPPPAPTGLVVAGGMGQAALSWMVSSNATSYNVKRSMTNGGPYTIVANVTTPSYTDTGLIGGTTCYYVVSAVNAGGESANSDQVSVTPALIPKLTGAIIGTPGSYNNSGNTIANVFDNNLNTYFDGPNSSNGNGCWVGLDFGAGTSNVIARINYCPRSGFESRIVGGIFQGANQADFSDAVALYTVVTQPTAGVFTLASITNTAAFRCVRYLSPNGGWGNVAELEFHGYASVPTPSAPSAPTGLVAAVVSSNQINLTWNAVTNASSYNVKRSLTNGGPYTTMASGVTATNYPDSGLAGGTIYYYVVSAIVSGTETTNSAQATGTTLSPTLGSLMHRYSFSETGGSTVADSVGGPAWAGTLPNGGSLSGGQLALSSGSQQYASLPAGIVGSLSNVTVMAWVNLASVSYWSRIFDFGNDTTTHMYLTPRNGFDYTARFAISTSGAAGEQKINCGVAINPGAWHQVAVTLNSGTGVLYVDGVAVETNGGLTLNPSSLGSTTHNYLGKSQSTSDPYLNGSLDEFRIYNVALSSAEVAATAALGPDQLLSTNPPLMGLALTETNLVITWPLANTGFTLQSCTDLTLGHWLSVPSPAPQIVSNQWQLLLPRPGDTSSAFYRLSK